MDRDEQEQVALHRWAVIAETAGEKLAAREWGRWSARASARGDFRFTHLPGSERHRPRQAANRASSSSRPATEPIS
jgi:hypothetical protein